MKIFSSKQIREWDAYTIKNEPISSIDLMERASEKFVGWFIQKFSAKQPIKIFAGVGNNGGDGLAIGRILQTKGYNISIFIVPFSDKPSADFKQNENRLISKPVFISSDSEFPHFSGEEIVIDGIFGSGLSRPIAGWLANLVNHMNQHGNEIVSIDIASGLFADSNNSEEDAIIKPDYTLSFQIPKLAFMMPQNELYVGEWHAVDIGLSKEYYEFTPTQYYYSDATVAKSLLKKRSKFSHKGSFGHLLLMAGSYGKIGAAVLSAKVALRTGVGLLSVAIPKCGYQIMQASVPEAMCQTDENDEYLSQLPELGAYNSIAIGPGISQSEETFKVLRLLVEEYNKPIVFDADALNLLAKNQYLLSQLPVGSILTPHPKEFERLVGKSENNYVRLGKLRRFSQKYRCCVLLKGAHSAIVCPDGSVYFNSTGNSGMATAGSGDVLTGIVASLLAQGYQPREATVLGVYLHGLSGDLGAIQVSETSLIASDIIQYIGQAYQILFQEREESFP